MFQIIKELHLQKAYIILYSYLYHIMNKAENTKQNKQKLKRAK